MNDETRVGVTSIATKFAENTTKFSRISLVSIDSVEAPEGNRAPCFAVRLALSHSSEDIERIIANSNPDEVDTVREFLEGDFYLTVIICGEVVVKSAWDKMDIS